SRHCERGHEAQRICARRVDQKPALQRQSDDLRSDLALEIQRQKQAAATHFGALVLLRQLRQPLGEMRTSLDDASEKARLAISSKTAHPTAVANALPLNVPPWSPYAKQQASLCATSAPRGMPPPSPLARTITSGSTPAC